MNAEDEAGAGVRWLTYRELAVHLGITLPAAEARARRGRWAKRPGNDGAVRIAVPASVLEPPPRATGDAPLAHDYKHMLDALQAAHEATVQGLRDRATAAEALAAVEREARTAAEIRAASAEGATRALQQAMEVLEAARQEAQGRATAAEVEGNALRDRMARAEEARQDEEAARHAAEVARVEAAALAAAETERAHQAQAQAQAQAEEARATLAAWQALPWWRRMLGG